MKKKTLLNLIILFGFLSVGLTGCKKEEAGDCPDATAYKAL